LPRNDPARLLRSPDRHAKLGFALKRAIMARRGTEAANAVRDVARSAGAHVTIKQRGRHQLALIEFGGLSRKVFIASSPSDRNAFKSAARDARRVLHEMGAPI
jgi:hypothetical protein